jgi:hypothetical protein
LRQIEQLEAELVILRAEAEFREKKAAGTLTREDRFVLRELREAYRLNDRPVVADGVQVTAIGAEAGVNL